MSEGILRDTDIAAFDEVLSFKQSILRKLRAQVDKTDIIAVEDISGLMAAGKGVEDNRSTMIKLRLQAERNDIDRETNEIDSAAFMHALHAADKELFLKAKEGGGQVVPVYDSERVQEENPGTFDPGKFGEGETLTGSDSQNFDAFREKHNI